MLRHIYVADRLALNNRNAKKTKEIGVRMWRTAYPNSTGGATRRGGAENTMETERVEGARKFLRRYSRKFSGNNALVYMFPRIQNESLKKEVNLGQDKGRFSC